MYQFLTRLLRRDAGMGTTEYALCTIAAAAFAAVLYGVVTGNDVAEMLSTLITDALDEP